MKITLNKYQFIDEFRKLRPNNFSYDGLIALFEYFDEYEQASGHEVEFDPIAICCEYEEYTNIAEYNTEHNTSYEDIDALNDKEESVISRINDEGFIVHAY